MLLTGIESTNSIEWILNFSETAILYKNDVTILCWITSNENGFLYSIDLHFQFMLEQQFNHIQAMVIQVSGNSISNFSAFQQSRDGRRQLSSCFKKPGETHPTCGKFEFYEKAGYDFNNVTMAISDFREHCKNLDGNEVVHNVFINFDEDFLCQTNQSYKCEDCLKNFETQDKSSIHKSNEHVIDVDGSDLEEINEGSQNSETSKHIFDLNL